MSEYHDTNEDERDWHADRLNRWNRGQDIRKDATTPRLVDILGGIVANTGDPWMQAGFKGEPAPVK